MAKNDAAFTEDVYAQVPNLLSGRKEDSNRYNEYFTGVRRNVAFTGNKAHDKGIRLEVQEEIRAKLRERHPEARPARKAKGIDKPDEAEEL